MLTVGSLFSGIGGLELGLEWAGLGPVKWQVEIDPYCRKVLAKHWPDATRYEDIRDVGKHNLEPVDLICGGFPCQDISYAGKGLGLSGERSGLWYEYARIVGEMGPRYVVVENVAALLNRGLPEVLGTLASCGYDAEWDIIPAGGVGFPHLRERVMLVAYPTSVRRIVQNDKTAGIFSRKCVSHQIEPRHRWKCEDGGHCMESVGWSVEPAICGSDDGIPPELAKCELKALGNSVVPLVSRVVGEMILSFETEHGC